MHLLDAVHSVGALKWKHTEEYPMSRVRTDYDDVLDAQGDLHRLIDGFGEAAESIATAEAEAAHPEDEIDETTGEFAGNFWSQDREAGTKAQVEILRQLFPILRDMLSKFSPEIWAEFLAVKAQVAANDAEYEAKLLAMAKAKGFDSYEALRKAERHARRSEAAKKAAVTRKENAEWRAKQARFRAAKETVQALADDSGATLH
ncbi:MAG: hypothetical protein ABSD31_13555 [Candidatus Binataceae bacterium]|jgi:hypothetical protein